MTVHRLRPETAVRLPDKIHRSRFVRLDIEAASFISITQGVRLAASPLAHFAFSHHFHHFIAVPQTDSNPALYWVMPFLQVTLYDLNSVFPAQRQPSFSR